MLAEKNSLARALHNSFKTLLISVVFNVFFKIILAWYIVLHRLVMIMV
jgi:ABC-type sulfate transport system permease component